MTVKGIDYSAYQTSPSLSGLAFAFRKITEGAHTVDPHWVTERDRIKKAGLVFGAYHFAHCENAWQDDFANFHNQINIAAGDLVVLDWEPYGQGVSDSHANAWKDAWLAKAKATWPHNQVGLYVNLDYWHREKTNDCGDFLWIADPSHPAGKPAVEHAWTFHQYSSTGNLDRDVANFSSKAKLQAWATSKKPPATKPKVSLAAVVYGATHSMADEKKHGSYADDVKHVQDALVKRKRLKSGSYHSGIFDVPTKTAYAAEQRAQGYHGADADGVPGHASLAELGKVTGLFTAVA